MSGYFSQGYYFGCKEFQQFLKALLLPEGAACLLICGDALQRAQDELLDDGELGVQLSQQLGNPIELVHRHTTGEVLRGQTH